MCDDPCSYTLSLISPQLFIVPLRQADPPIIRPSELDIFIKTVFSTILDVRACTKRVLDALIARQREQAPVINAIGDIFLEAATQFRVTYSHYLGHLPAAEKRVQEEMDSNVMFRVFVQVKLKFLILCVI